MVTREGAVQVSWEGGAWEPAGAGVLGSLGACRQQGQDTGTVLHTVNRGVLLVLLMACGSEDLSACCCGMVHANIVLLPCWGREKWGACWGRRGND